MSLQPLARLTGAHKRFGKIAALDGLNLAVNRGEMLALLGPNGAGKSTAISILLGLQSPDRGSAELFGEDPQLHRRTPANRRHDAGGQPVAGHASRAS